MIIRYEASDRKRMAGIIAGLTNEPVQYLGVPSFAYKVGNFLITWEGNVEVDGETAPGIVEEVREGLSQMGFKAPSEEPLKKEEESMGAADDSPQEADTAPQNGVDGELEHGEAASLTLKIREEDVNLENLDNLLAAKEKLLAKALGITALTYTLEDGHVAFPWFEDVTDADEADACMKLVSAMCRMSREQKRISPKAKVPANEKYAFRCFLLRLGFIGSEYKTARKILLRNFEGSSAFRDGRRDGHADSGQEDS